MQKTKVEQKSEKGRPPGLLYSSKSSSLILEQ